MVSFGFNYLELDGHSFLTRNVSIWVVCINETKPSIVYLHYYTRKFRYVVLIVFVNEQLFKTVHGPFIIRRYLAYICWHIAMNNCDDDTCQILMWPLVL